MSRVFSGVTREWKGLVLLESLGGWIQRNAEWKGQMGGFTTYTSLTPQAVLGICGLPSTEFIIPAASSQRFGDRSWHHF